MDKFVQQGFDVNDPSTVIVLEGVTGYLPEAAVKETFQRISSRCVRVTQMVVTFLRESSSWFKPDLKWVGEERLFWIVPGQTVQSLVESLGFRVDFVEEVSLSRETARKADHQVIAGLTPV